MLESDVAHVAADGRRLVPSDNMFEGLSKIPAWMPVETCPRLGAVQLQIGSLVRLWLAIQLPPRFRPPKTGELLDDPLHGSCIVFTGAKIEPFGEFVPFEIKLFGQCEIATQGFEHMLPGADGIRIADRR